MSWFTDPALRVPPRAAQVRPRPHWLRALLLGLVGLTPTYRRRDR